MDIKDLEKHCKKQLERLPKTSQMYEEHLLILAVIETNKEYFNKLEKKDRIINLMALAILNYDDQLVINKYKDIDEVKETFEEYLNKVEREGK